MSAKKKFLCVLACAGMLGAAMLFTGGAGANAAGTSPVPPILVPPPGNELIATFAAQGVQVYKCANGSFVFLEPAANLIGFSPLLDSIQTTIHFRGPSWESTDDGSLVEAQVVAVSPVPGSIPELLLKSTLNRGNGIFGKVTFIQRLKTKGGVAPVGGCTDGDTVGVKYTAEYRFFAPVGV
ncbi:MAG TPA: DUF3455 domain-containing protein [Candidatus Limnocylindrales bacterium]|nr:DUF3455 domain-containing protein [Candidatus Limnocylindrales bacterium]